MAGVKFSEVYKRFGDVEVIKNLNVEIQDREFVVIVGPSGCGKSTSLRMIAGLETISEGLVKIGDRVVNDIPPKDRDIAMVFQNYALYPHMNVYKNMAFGLKLRKFPKSKIDSRVHKAAEILGIEELLERKPKQLSGGQRQRVAVGRAIVREPSVFLFDEPLSNLDAKLRVQMRSEIKKLHMKLKATMIYVTHDQVEAMTMGDRIVILKDGLLQQSGPPLKVYRYPSNQFVAGFIGSPAMNFLPVNMHTNNGNVQMRADDLLIEIPIDKLSHLDLDKHKSVIFGIRPEDMFAMNGSDELPSLEGKVELVETTGSESLVHLRLNESLFVAKVSSDLEINAHDKLTLFFPPEKIHLFSNDEQKNSLRKNL